MDIEYKIRTAATIRPLVCLKKKRLTCAHSIYTLSVRVGSTRQNRAWYFDIGWEFGRG